MTLHILVEGASERAFLSRWAGRLLKAHPIRIHPHQGKGRLPTDLAARPDPRRRGLLDQLPATLRGFASSSQPHHVVVLVDADDDDPSALSSAIAKAAHAVAPALEVVVRVAVEETEAFYLGDLNALARAYPEADMALASSYEPDSVCGTWELFARVIGDGGENKTAWAEAMGQVVTTAPRRSRSPSFRSLATALVELLPPVPAAAQKRRSWRHVARTNRRR
ncbi:MAG: DUF4276 family protein [Labilithrix sp.]|nr:DUF4276 family protein [Labilithrix sp.]MBX3216455.1 DUF4276 family protein [Labilithrix sp.]